MAWSVRASKKGDLLVSTEKRALGKDVTLLKMVEAHPDLLLAELRVKLGTGGTTYGSTVERWRTLDPGRHDRSTLIAGNGGQTGLPMAAGRAHHVP